jgi:hypothetical protein
MKRTTGRFHCALFLTVLAGCGVRSALHAPAPRPRDADVEDGRVYDACAPTADRCVSAEVCGNGADDDCDGRADEDCPCTAGSVQSCFAGPPGRRNVGACSDGQQICTMAETWGDCLGGILPRADVCNGLDNLCDGCSAMNDCEISCPGPDDPRVPRGTPFAPYALDGGAFYPGTAAAWRWSIDGGVCDHLAARLVSYDLADGESEHATFTPRLSGDYTVTLDVTTLNGNTLSCSYVVRVEAPGLRVEMCYPESETQDLDLLVHEPGNFEDWYPPGATAHMPTAHACSWANCEPIIRGTMGRADWGYAWSPLDRCQNGPFGGIWQTLGGCANPRLDLDNNLDEGIGVPENINIDAPRDGETFRVMVQNFTGARARPVVNVYCDGARLGTYGAAPDTVPGFQGRSGNFSAGAMWRVVDVTTRVGADGSLGCELVPLHPPRRPRRYFVTQDDGRY